MFTNKEPRTWNFRYQRDWIYHIPTRIGTCWKQIPISSSLIYKIEFSDKHSYWSEMYFKVIFVKAVLQFQFLIFECFKGVSSHALAFKQDFSQEWFPLLQLSIFSNTHYMNSTPKSLKLIIIYNSHLLVILSGLRFFVTVLWNLKYAWCWFEPWVNY